MPSDQLQIVLQIVKGRPKFEGTVQEQRALMETGAKAFPIPPDVTCEPVSAGGVPSEWVSAPGAEPGRVVMYLHGGGYTLCSINTHREMIARIARAAAARALAIDYRLAPYFAVPHGDMMVSGCFGLLWAFAERHSAHRDEILAALDIQAAPVG